MLRRPALAAAGIAAAATLAPLCAADAQNTTIRLRMKTDIRSTDPGTNRDGPTDGVVQHMVEGLVAFREDTSVGPLLAERYDVSADGKTYTFTLRPDVRFHNGAPLTADDVVWSWQRYLDAATQWRCRPEFTGGLAKLESIAKTDDHTVVFTFDRPSALIPATMARVDCGGSGSTHRDSVGPDGKWRDPIGTGPFKMGEWRRGQHVELVRFDQYASRDEARDGYTGGKKAAVDRIRFVVIPDAAAAKAALMSGASDIDPDIEPEDFAELKARPGLKFESATTMSMATVIFQTRDKVMQDVRIRRALALAIDTAEITDAVTAGTAKPNNSVIPISSPYYTKVQAGGYTRDLAAARKLLAEAGYGGQPIKLLANKRFKSSFDVAVLVQAAAQQVGLKIDIEVLDWATQLDRYTKGDFQIQSFPYSARLDPALSYEMVTGPKATQPRKVWDNPEVEAILRQSMQIADRGKRQVLFDTLHRRQIEELPLIMIYNEVQIAAMRTALNGYKAWPTGQPRLWGVTLN
ncbi:ABC transporter substrate-binding protein [Vineibacter terrae]|nr:ABC transporter substrate-binding protein [Vineibacter terrae]